MDHKQDIETDELHTEYNMHVKSRTMKCLRRTMEVREENESSLHKLVAQTTYTFRI